jgi:two-component system sensor kinase FixL
VKRLWRILDGAPLPAPAGRWRASAYAGGGALAAAAVVVRLLLDPILGDRVVFLFFVPAVLAASALGGTVPGLAITLLATLVGSVLLARHGVILANVVDAGLFVLLGCTIALGGHRLRRVQGAALEANQHLAEREVYLQSVLETVPDAMIIIDEHGVMQSFSSAAERLFGWTADEARGRNVSLLMPSPDREAHDGYMARYALTGQPRIIGKGRVVVAQRKDGSTFPVALTVGEMNLGGRRFFTGFLQDLSEREAAEERLRTMQAELIHISRLSAMGEMGSTLAHELNQPLSAIANYLRGARRILDVENPGSRIGGALDKAADQALRAGEIIRRLREFVARGDSERRVESLPRLLDEIGAVALLGAKERGVSIVNERDPAVDAVLVDKVQVQQVVLNLMRNALEAMAESPRRELRVSVAADGPDMARVSVADTGPGVSPEIADRLFQPFVTTKGGQGMGVGLSICRTIINGHGGRIWTEPAASGGVAFHFTVPRATRGGDAS